jgi:hypothetical protein
MVDDPRGGLALGGPEILGGITGPKQRISLVQRMEEQNSLVSIKCDELIFCV